VIAGLDHPGRVPRLLQDGESEARIGHRVAAVELVEAVHGEVERRRRPLGIVGDRRAQRQHLGGVVVTAGLQLRDLVHRLRASHCGLRVGLQRHEGFVGGGTSHRLGNAVDDGIVVVGGGQLVLQAGPGIGVVAGPDATDRLV